MKIRKKLEISTGHRLHLHQGGCSNFHGHNYQVFVTIAFNEKTESYIDKVGFYLDFKEIKEAINSNFDHLFLISNLDPFLPSVKELPGIRVVQYSPTAENITKEMVTNIGEILSRKDTGTNITDFDVKIRLYETSTAFVEVHKTFIFKNLNENTKSI